MCCSETIQRRSSCRWRNKYDCCNVKVWRSFQTFEYFFVLVLQSALHPQSECRKEKNWVATSPPLSDYQSCEHPGTLMDLLLHNCSGKCWKFWMFPPSICRYQINAEQLLWKGKDCLCNASLYFFQKLDNSHFDFLGAVQVVQNLCNPWVHLWVALQKLSDLSVCKTSFWYWLSLVYKDQQYPFSVISLQVGNVRCTHKFWHLHKRIVLHDPSSTFLRTNPNARLTLAAHLRPLKTKSNFLLIKVLSKFDMANLKTGCLPFSSSESTRKCWHA